MSMRVLPTVALCCVAGVLAAAAGASINPEGPPLPVSTAQKQPDKSKRFDVTKSPDLWATITVCDTKGEPNTIGIRGSMPGMRGSKPANLEMRFTVQFRTGPGQWKDTGETADSGWLDVGRTRTKVIETGQDFRFAPPSTGQHTLRGVVKYRWKRAGKIRETAEQITEVGHRSTAGADPAGYSASQCNITAP